MQKLRYLLIIIMVLMLGACNMPGREISPAEMTAIIDRSVAETVLASTDPAAPPADSSTEGENTTAEGESEPEVSSDTPDPGSSDPPTNTPEPSDTPTPSDTPVPCNLGKFITDITIPDGTEFEPGDVFTKTWRLKNVGSCAWTSGYDIVFSGGDAMNAPSAVQITSGTATPGQNVDVSVDLTAPATEGTYRGNWQLRDPSNVIFSIENSSSGFFWVEIEVEEPAAPVSVTLHPSSRSGSLSNGGGSDAIIKCGIAPNGDALRGFVDYDLDPLAGLSSSSTIQVATLDMTDYSGIVCFNDIAPLKAGVITFGSTLDYPGDFTEAFSATLFNVPSGLGISGPVSITSELQDFVDNNGAGHFQFRMELDGDNMGSGFACMMRWDDPVLNITYLP